MSTFSEKVTIGLSVVLLFLTIGIAGTLVQKIVTPQTITLTQSCPEEQPETLETEAPQEIPAPQTFLGSATLPGFIYPASWTVILSEDASKETTTISLTKPGVFCLTCTNGADATILLSKKTAEETPEDVLKNLGIATTSFNVIRDTDKTVYRYPGEVSSETYIFTKLHVIHISIPETSFFIKNSSEGKSFLESLDTKLIP